jgi:hypothetical protein
VTSRLVFLTDYRKRCQTAVLGQLRRRKEKRGNGSTYRDDGLHIERSDRSEVDDLALNALLGKRLSDLEAVSDRLGVGNEGDVRTLSLDLGLADGKEELMGVVDVVRTDELPTSSRVERRVGSTYVVLHGGLGHGEGNTVPEKEREGEGPVSIEEGLG